MIIYFQSNLSADGYRRVELKLPLHDRYCFRLQACLSCQCILFHLLMMHSFHFCLMIENELETAVILNYLLEAAHQLHDQLDKNGTPYNQLGEGIHKAGWFSQDGDFAYQEVVKITLLYSINNHCLYQVEDRRVHIFFCSRPPKLNEIYNCDLISITNILRHNSSFLSLRFFGQIIITSPPVAITSIEPLGCAGRSV